MSDNHTKRTIKHLLATAGEAARSVGLDGTSHPGPRSLEEQQRDLQRRLARVAWAKDTLDKLYEAQRQMDERCDQAVDKVSEAEFNRLFEAEQAKVDAIRAEIDDVVERDVWPRALYFGGI